MTPPPVPRSAAGTAGRFGVGRLCGEAMRNRLARAGLSLAVLAVWAVAGLVVYGSERDAVRASSDHTSSMLASGYATLLVEQSALAREPFMWEDCNTLRHLAGVHAVLALREPEILRLWDRRGPEITTRQAIGDVAGFLAVTSPGEIERWVAPSLIFDIDAFGARPANGGVGEYVTTVVSPSDDADTRTAITANLVGLGGGFAGNAIVMTPPGGPIAVCAVLADLEQRTRVADAVAGFLALSAGFGQRWALADAERFDSPRERFESRDSRWYWLAASVVITVSSAFSLWIVRSDLAVFAVAGLGTRRLVGLTIAELLVVAVGAGAIVVGVVAFDLVVHGDAHDAIDVGVRAALRSAVAGFGVGSTLAAVTAVSIARRPIDVLNDR